MIILVMTFFGTPNLDDDAGTTAGLINANAVQTLNMAQGRNCYIIYHTSLLKGANVREPLLSMTLYCAINGWA